MKRTHLEVAILGCGFAAAIAAGVLAYRDSGKYGAPYRSDPRVKRVIDPNTGRLQLLIYDSDGDGKFDTWSYMDGDRVIRIAIDTDGDGQVDRMEEVPQAANHP